MSLQVIKISFIVFVTERILGVTEPTDKQREAK